MVRYDEQRRREMEEEMVSIFLQTLTKQARENGVRMRPAEADKICQCLMEEVVEVTSPLETDHGSGVGVISLNVSHSAPSGATVKPGNIHFNMRRFVELCSSSTLMTAGVVAPSCHWMAPLAVLVLLSQMASVAEIKLSEREVIVLYAMWRSGGKNNRIHQNDVLFSVNEVCRERELASLTPTMLHNVLEHLHLLQCILPSLEDSQTWLLCERVNIQYT